MPVGSATSTTTTARAQKPSKSDQAYALFLKWVENTNRPYHGGIVREYLDGALAQGKSPKQALQALIAAIPR